MGIAPNHTEGLVMAERSRGTDLSSARLLFLTPASVPPEASSRYGRLRMSTPYRQLVADMDEIAFESVDLLEFRHGHVVPESDRKQGVSLLDDVRVGYS